MSQQELSASLLQKDNFENYLFGVSWYLFVIVI